MWALTLQRRVIALRMAALRSYVWELSPGYAMSLRKIAALKLGSEFGSHFPLRRMGLSTSLPVHGPLEDARSRLRPKQRLHPTRFAVRVSRHVKPLIELNSPSKHFLREIELKRRSVQSSRYRCS